jgi:hypothetical protein
MSLRSAVVVFALLVAAPLHAQDAPVIRARSRVVTITDGLHVKKNFWYVMPERRPDVYYVEIPRQPHTVTFTTDVESISFPVTYGSQHDFVIRLENGVDALTQVRAVHRNPLTYVRPDSAPASGPDPIPFTLGDNDKIYVKGRINGGPPLDFQFDLGAGGSIIKKASVSKVSMHFDGTIRLRNSDGDNEVPMSSANRLEIAGLTWDKVGFAVADNMTWREDGLIGNGLFVDKVIEIDYDRMLIVVHDTLPPLSSGWMQQELILDGVVPFTRGTLEVDGTTQRGWFLLDTGAYTSILNSEQLSAPSKIVREFRQMVGGGPQGPSIAVGPQAFAAPNYSVRNYDGDPSSLGLLGNDILSRFNLVLDNRGGSLYLRPNSRLQGPFRNPEYYLVRVVTFAGVLLATATTWWVRRRARRRSSVASP